MLQTLDIVERYKGFADGIAALFHPHVEVVIHDLRTQTVAYIANNFSKRMLGDEAGLDEMAFDPSEASFGPYQKINWDGRTIRSVSIVGRNDIGAAIAVVCINMDISIFETIRASLDAFLVTPLNSQPEKLFRDDWQERINIFLNEWMALRRLTLSSIGRPEKRELIEALFDSGAFAGRSSAPYIATVLGLSRATVFNQLRVLRSHRTESADTNQQAHEYSK